MGGCGRGGDNSTPPPRSSGSAQLFGDKRHYPRTGEMLGRASELHVKFPLAARASLGGGVVLVVALFLPLPAGEPAPPASATRFEPGAALRYRPASPAQAVARRPSARSEREPRVSPRIPDPWPVNAAGSAEESPFEDSA